MLTDSSSISSEKMRGEPLSVSREDIKVRRYLRHISSTPAKCMLQLTNDTANSTLESFNGREWCWFRVLQSTDGLNPVHKIVSYSSMELVLHWPSFAAA